MKWRCSGRVIPGKRSNVRRLPSELPRRLRLARVEYYGSFDVVARRKCQETRRMALVSAEAVSRLLPQSEWRFDVPRGTGNDQALRRECQETRRMALVSAEAVSRLLPQSERRFDVSRGTGIDQARRRQLCPRTLAV